jgi:hypothetical protein
MGGTDGTVVKERYTGKSNGPVLRSTGKEYEVRTTKRGSSKTWRQIGDTGNDDETVKMGNISAPVIKEDISAFQEDVPAIQEEISEERRERLEWRRWT